MYNIIYENNTIFNGGNLQNSKWNEINKPIKKLEYNIINKKIVMQGYEQYNHLIEKSYIIGNGINCDGILLMGLKNNKVEVIKINLKTKKIFSYKTIFGQEYREASTTGWKEGTRDLTCGFEIS